ncbi:DEAD/DEAH box helicase domain protein [Desulfarculus baarsii DSM 2075]|uniref:DEAD/DEAH box helicase domain protein n=1 Tax=Desulfarculus baarsii (strain ATCC 33931 / DSM 2075 / LMG 7858 / VKM B-1802 / 2st14) TaxID=644282 RepID=E1QK74_DESB2|nr:DEAD/DEAH box helicase [Desulfarculus baarsii]ADK85967.1 DEAD/DEAH box helicase domain protein [Desulfarculus baarsii DSM 2075]
MTAHRTKTTGRRPTAKGPPRRRPEKPVRDQEPSIHPKLLPVLEHIGVPQATAFAADPFQAEAVEKLAEGDVVVSAPTGSGKTWIAEQAIAQALAQGQRAWYASPLKALSNAKYHEFGAIFGPERVGILTGDRKENSQAPLIVGTTEILRNQLYDAMHRGENIDSSLVVLDEAHYLGDPDRGVVWEEVIIYLPPRVRLLLLSATVENAEQLARWLMFVRGNQCRTVRSDQRPVPLFPVFMFPDGELAPLKTRRGLLGKISHFLEQEARQPKGGRQINSTPQFANILSALDHAAMLPAIFFLKSRADCDNALAHAAGARLAVDQAQGQRLNRFVDDFLAEYPFLADHPQLEPLRRLRVAAHHAGHLPHWKLLVERLMQTGLLRAIFSTSTVAAGVNFPARTVVVTQSDRFNGREFVDLRATDLLQMTGRAGRRGMDNIGFALIVPGPYQNVPLLAGLLNANPEPIESQLHINFSMALNLLLSQRPAEIKQLLGCSLATFQRLERRGAKAAGEGGMAELMRQLAPLLAGSNCHGPEEAVVRRKRRRQLDGLRRRLAHELESMEQEQGLWAALTRGRVFIDMFGAMAAVLRREGRGEDAGVLAVSLIPDRRLQRGRPRLDFVPIDEIAGVFHEVIDLPVAGGGRVLAQAVLEQIPDAPRALSGPELENLGLRERDETKLRLQEVESQIDSLACVGCAIEGKCLHGGPEIEPLLQRAEQMLSQVREESHAFWYDFVRHLEFLRSEGFVDSQGGLTQDGLWASKLRLDQPVLIAQAIRSGALPQNDPVLLAALLALFVDDRERESDSPYLSQRLREGLATLLADIEPLLERLRQWGFHTPALPMPAASAMFAWALGQEFADVVALYGGAEGDLAALIYRTADNLRQIASLHDTHPALSASAREAVELLLRPPVVLPT